MPNPLLPSIDQSQRVSVHHVLADTAYVATAISTIAESQTLLDKFLRPVGEPISNGGLLYSVLSAEEFYSSDVEARNPGAEYRAVEAQNPEARLALVSDFGGWFEVLDEERDRDRIRDIARRTTQLGNAITKKLDAFCMKHIAEADIVTYQPETNWANLVFVGDPTTITPSKQRPTAAWAEAQLLATMEELGVQHDLLVMNPEQETQLKIAYEDTLDAALTSNGLSLFSNPRVPEGVVYALERGHVGFLAFERPLTVDIIDERRTRRTLVQAYCVPLVAIDRPYACKKIVLPA